MTSLDSMHNTIRQAVRRQGTQLAQATPSAIAVGLAGAALLPALLGDLSLASPVLAGTLGLLGELGTGALLNFISDFLKRLGEKQQAGQTPTEAELREQLEHELLEHWEAGGETAAALRADVSRLLQAVQGVEAALAAATADVKEALAHGLADLGGRFDEFGWILDEVRQALAEVRTRQALQLALQREQLDLQRQQLVKTNLILHLQQVRAGVPTSVSTADTKDEDLPPADVPCPYKGLAAFSSDGTRLATASFDGTAKVWNVTTGQELLTLTGHQGGVTGVVFSPDGTRLVTTSQDGTARVYVLPIEELMALARSRVTRSLTVEECRQ